MIRSLRLQILFSFLFSFPGLIAQVCFNPIFNQQTGAYPCSIVTADFNNDGLPDLVTANHWGNNVTMILGLGAGTFTSVANYAAGDEPIWITTADYNEDGNPDVATANHGSNDVSVFFGNGAGQFAPAVFFTTRGEPSCIASADVNGDLNSDLVVTNMHYDSVSIHLGDGAGNFSVKGYYLTGYMSDPNTVSAADVNNAGKVDLVIDNWSDNIVVLLGDGTGAFGPPAFFYTSGIKSTHAITGDFNMDGFLDIAACNYFSDDVSILNGDGTGNFSASVNFPIGGVKPYTLWSGDFNADGKTDLVTSNETSNTISVILGNGNGSFGQPIIFPADSNTEQSIVGDFNADGKDDIAAVNFGANNATVFLSAPSPVVTANSSADTICAGSQVTLNGGGALTYTWSNSVSNGIAFTPGNTATYLVAGTDNLGCTNWDTITVVLNICTGMDPVFDAASVIIFPNPAYSDVIIQTNLSQKQLIQVFDVDGRLIWQQLTRGGQTVVLSGDLKAGIYNVRLSTEKESLSKRLVLIK